MVYKSLTRFVLLFILLQLVMTPMTPLLGAATACDEYSEFPGSVPANIALFTTQGKFNNKLWIEKGITVYGCVHSFSEGNDFSPGTQSDSANPASYDPAGGYYVKNGVKDEYRYHGYDKFGNKHINLQFANDANSSRKSADKQWLYHPWEELPVSLPSRPANPGAIYGISKPELAKFSNLNKNVKRSMGFQINNGLKLSNNSRI